MPQVKNRAKFHKRFSVTKIGDILRKASDDQVEPKALKINTK